MAILTNTEVGRTFQIGVQVDDNVAVPANKRLPDIAITPGWDRTSTAYTPATYRFPTISVQGKEWSTFTIDGPIGFASVWYFLSSGGNYAAPTGAGPYTWANTPNITGVDASKSYTLEWGVAAAAFRAVGAHCVGLHFHFEYDKPTFKAEMVAKRIEAGITLTASPTTIENVPVPGPSIQISQASSFANLSVPASLTALRHGYVFDMDITNIYGQEWALRRGVTSWGDRYLTMPAATAKLSALEQLAGADFSGTPFNLAMMRAGGLAFIRVDAVGPVIGGAGLLGSVLIAEPGTGYTGTPTAVVNGDGTGAAITLTATAGVITAYAITTPGTGYTYATITVTGAGTGALLVPQLTPSYGFGINAAVMVGPGGPSPSYLSGLKTNDWPLLLATDPTSVKAFSFDGTNQLASL